MDKPTVLYISYDGLTDPLGQSQILPYIFGLSRAGYRFVIVSFEKPDRYEKYGKALRETLEKNDIGWYCGRFRSGIPGLSKMADMREMHRLSRKACVDFKPSIIHCRSYVASLAGLKLSEKYHIPFIFDMRGLWADERFDAGIWSRSNPLRRMQYRYFIRKEKEFLTQSAHVVSLTYKAIEILETRHQVNLQNKSSVVRTCTDTAFFNTLNLENNRKEIRRQLGVRDEEFMLVYSGSTGTWYMVKEMIHFFSVLLKIQPDSRFLLLTRTAPEEILPWLGNEIRDKVIVQPSPYNEVCKWLNACDAGIYFIHPWFSKNASTATKTGEMAACGLPVVANPIGDMEAVFAQYRLGILISDFSEATYETAAREILKIKPGTISIPAEYELESAVKTYYEIYCREGVDSKKGWNHK